MSPTRIDVERRLHMWLYVIWQVNIAAGCSRCKTGWVGQLCQAVQTLPIKMRVICAYDRRELGRACKGHQGQVQHLFLRRPQSRHGSDFKVAG